MSIVPLLTVQLFGSNQKIKNFVYFVNSLKYHFVVIVLLFKKKNKKRLIVNNKNKKNLIHF
jgi:hypothetical protein